MKKHSNTISYKPYTPSRRFMTKEDFSTITDKKAYKKLRKSQTSKSGRDRFGHISVNHRGGRHKRHYRIINSLQKYPDMNAKVVSIQYDPNRSSRIALVEFENKDKIYIICPEKLNIGDQVKCAEKVAVKTANRMKLENIPTGTEVHDIESMPSSKGRFVRSAGCSATVLAKAEGEGKRANYIQIRMPSGEIRLLHKDCYASIGMVSNQQHSNVKIGKAGRNRWLGKRPVVRGKAKNPVDHPHGGGEGGNPIGLKYPKTPTGKPAMGYKTRKNKRTKKFIVKRRNEK